MIREKLTGQLERCIKITMVSSNHPDIMPKIYDVPEGTGNFPCQIFEVFKVIWARLY